MSTLLQKGLLDTPTCEPEDPTAADAIGLRVQDLEKQLEARRFNMANKPPEAPVRYFIGETPICTSGNITTISAAVKSGKSSFVGAIMAAAMTCSSKFNDCLGVRSENPEGRALIHLDTEQSPADHYALVDRVLRRAGLTEPPTWLQSYCVTGFSVTELHLCLDLLLEKSSKSGGIHSVLIDGVADFVSDVNDATECNSLVRDLHAYAIKYDCPIIGVIHLNPGTEKTRGHLGSQLERKAETNLRLEKENEAIVVWSDKNRKAPITKENGPRFRWSDRDEMHVSIETLKSSGDKDESERLTSLAEDAFGDRPAMRYSELISTVKAILEVSTKTAERRVERMKYLGVIKKAELGLYVKGR